MRRLLLPLLLLLSLAPPASAQTRPADPFDAVHVYLITVGAGDAVYEKFGHNMIRIAGPNGALDVPADPPTATEDLAFNWGMFSFEQENFVWRFIQGRMLYSAGALLYAEQLDDYRASKREMWQQELNLTPDQKRHLWLKLITTVQPAHRDYRYDYYRDNCSTRVRDALDEATGGQLRPQLTGVPTNTTYRWHTRRLTRVNFPLYTALDYVLGHPVDRPIDAWEECFLPVRMMGHVATLRVKDAAGNDAPFVLSTEQLNPATIYAEPQSPPNWFWLFSLLGISLGAAFTLLSRRGTGARLAAIPFLLLAFAWSLLGGAGGAISTWGWLFTDHVVSRYNENWLQLSPVMLPLALLVPALFLSRRRGVLRAIAGLATVQLALNLLGLLLQALPNMNQPNGEIIALCLPANAGLAYALTHLARRRLPNAPLETEPTAAAGGVGAARPRAGG